MCSTLAGMTLELIKNMSSEAALVREMSVRSSCREEAAEVPRKPCAANGAARKCIVLVYLLQ